MAKHVGVGRWLNRMMLIFVGTHEVTQSVEICLFSGIEIATGQQSINDPLGFAKVLV